MTNENECVRIDLQAREGLKKKGENMTHEEKKTLRKILWETKDDIAKIAFGGRNYLLDYHDGETKLLDRLHDAYFAITYATVALTLEIDEEETK